MCTGSDPTIHGDTSVMNVLRLISSADELEMVLYVDEHWKRHMQDTLLQRP